MKTSTLFSTIQRLIDNNLLEVHTSMPGKIIDYDASKRLASVKPVISRRLKDGRVLEMPIINNVPVVFPGTLNSIISFPLVKNDGVLLIFSERSIDEYMLTGNTTFPEDLRNHDISDAVAIPGLFNFKIDNGASNTDVVIKFNNSLISISPAGDIKVNAGVGSVALGNNSDELLDLVSILMGYLVNTTVNTQLGPQPLSSASTIAALQTRLDAIKGSL